MITPRGGIDGNVLQTPRGVPSLDMDRVSLTDSPRKSPHTKRVVENLVNLGQYQRKRFEAVSRQSGTMTQEVVQMLHSVIRNAMLCGSTHMRIQTFRVSDDYQYRYRSLVGKDAHVIHDSHTLVPFAGTKAKVIFNTHMDSFFKWLQHEGIHFIVTTKLMNTKVTFGELPFANFVHVEAIFIPEDTDLREQTGRVLSLWNTVYTAKCLDNSMVQQWNQRALAAIRSGLGHFVVCTLYLESDYSEAVPSKETGLVPCDKFTCVQPREHLTMQLLDPDPRWRLDRKFAYLVGWVRQLGYDWTLTCGWSRDEARASLWAYFTVMLDPLERYE